MARLIAHVAEIAPGLQRRRALDFGCGVGRLTRALAEHFGRVVGVDLAPTMIRSARALNRSCVNCRFHVNRSTRLRLRSGRFDLVYSRLVLQHIPPRRLRRYFPELVRVLAPGGLLVFQLPDVVAVDPREAFVDAPVADTRLKRLLPGWAVRAYRRLKYRVVARDPVARMEMFGMAQKEVVALLRRAAAEVVEIRDDDSHGTSARGYEYWVRKAAPAGATARAPTAR